MPRRNRQLQIDSQPAFIELTEDRLLTDMFERSNIVSDYLANQYYDLLKETKKEITCPVCMEEICCKKCFTLLRCGHYCCLYEYVKMNKCPVCRNS